MGLQLLGRLILTVEGNTRQLCFPNRVGSPCGPDLFFRNGQKRSGSRHLGKVGDFQLNGVKGTYALFRIINSYQREAAG